MEQITIRRAQESDALALAQIHVDAWLAAYKGTVPDAFLTKFTVEQWHGRFREALAAGAWETYVALVDEQAVGILTIGACRDDDLDVEQTGEVWGIYLAPAHWRKGFGQQIMAEAERMLVSRGYVDAVLWVLEENQDARRFYEAMGFSLDGASKTVNLGEPLKAVRYRKEL